MHRVHPKELLEIAPEDSPRLEDVSNTPERKRVTTFSWSMAISHFEKVIKTSANKAAVYYLDGHLILNASYMQNVTEEICKEYGLELVDSMVDLVVPIGFAYEPLFGSLPQLVEDAFKPLSKTGQRKVIVWVEDEHWNNPEKCIVAPFVQQLLLSKAEPFLIAPSKYFDQEIISIFSKKIFHQISDEVTEKTEAECSEAAAEKTDSQSENFAKTFAILVKFGFLLALRAVLHCPVIILHFGQPVSEMVDAFQLLDLAEAEGHKIKYLKNTAADLKGRRKIIDNFVQKLQADVPSAFTHQGSRLNSASAKAESESEAEEGGSAETHDEGWEILEPDEYVTLSD